MPRRGNHEWMCITLCMCAVARQQVAYLLWFFHRNKYESTQSRISSNDRSGFIHRIFVQILKIYNSIIFENYNENSLEVLIFAKWTKFNLHFIHLTLYWESVQYHAKVAENVVEPMAKAMKIEYIDVRVQNGWNRDIKKGRQSILKSILNQHNTQSKSSRYFKIIERCSNGLLHTYPYTHTVFLLIASVRGRFDPAKM